MQERYREEMERERGRTERESHTLNPSEMISRTLVACEAGRPEQWIRLANELTLTEASRHYGEIHCSNITSQPGWEHSDLATRNRIAACAERYLLNENPRVDAWFDDPNTSGGDYAIAGVKALHLLRDTSTATFHAIEDSVWATWLPALLDFHPMGSDEESRKMQMLAEACQRVPVVFRDNLLRALGRENRRRSLEEEIRENGERVPIEREFPTSLPRQLEACWNPELAELLRVFATDTANATVRGNIVDELVKHNDHDTVESITERLSGTLSTVDVERMHARSDASSLILHAPEIALPLLDGLADSEPEFCRDVIQSWVSLRSFADDEANALLSSQVLARYYILLRRLFPPEEDVRIDGAHGMTAREMVERKRDSMLSHLVSRDSYDAMREVQAISRAFPDNMSLRLTVLEAQRRALQADWTPLQPSDVRSMIANSERRSVRSGQELISVLIESIGRFEAELQGETPQNFTLWDKQQPRKVNPTDEKPSIFFRSKEEERLSDALRRHLERDLRERGIVTNREVEIRPRQGTGGDPGERTDIHVDAVSRLRHHIERIRVIVEVKGCWNREVNIAITTQLRDRYLKDNDCSHGLYVVGWHLCGQWDSRDGRNGEARRQMPNTLADARQRFSQQAAAESNESATLAAVVLDCSLR